MSPFHCFRASGFIIWVHMKMLGALEPYYSILSYVHIIKGISHYIWSSRNSNMGYTSDKSSIGEKIQEMGLR